MIRVRGFIFFVLMLCWFGVAFARIAVDIHPNKVHLGESFRLTFTMDVPPGGIPNLIPLQLDFSIIGTERTMAYSVINGQTISEAKWTVILSPKKIGVLTIPSVQIGHQQSIPMQIEVVSGLDASLSDQGEDAKTEGVQLKTTVSVSKPFVNQQVLYTVKLYHHQQLLDAAYQPPQVEDALMVPLGDARRYESTLEGRPYAVEEQKYAIFSQKKGPLTIHSPTLNALVMASIPERLSARTKDTTLQVLPVPKQEKAIDWLPASQVSLTEIYDQGDTLKEGNTLTRTVTLQAQGLPAQLLPNLSMVGGPLFHVYMEKPILTNTASDQALMGRMEVKATYLLNHAGQITLPKVQVPWFDTVTGKNEVATLPARSFFVGAKMGSSASQTKSSSVAPKVERVNRLIPVAHHATDAWVKWFFGLVVCVGVLFALKGRLCARYALGKAFKRLHRVCVRNNAVDAQVALLDWARLRWPEVECFDMQDFASWVHDVALKKQITVLSEVLYGADRKHPWQGRALWRAVIVFLRKKAVRKNRRCDLPPIHL
ncbi:MAG: BatD family protein [Legionellales bacterium]|nr:BatD family protein [Legionellales bacterium]